MVSLRIWLLFFVNFPGSRLNKSWLNTYVF